jgi:hypothetical protein
VYVHYLFPYPTAGSVVGQGRGFDSRWVIGFFDLPNPSSRTMSLGSTQPLTKINTRNLPGGKGRPAHKAENLTAICVLIV